MSDDRAAGRNRWLPPFVASLALFALSLAYLGYVVLDAVTGKEGGGSGQRHVAGATAADGNGSGAPGDRRALPLAYQGTPPSQLDLATFREAAPGSEADIVFEGAGAGDAIHRYFVPVVPLDTGVDALTRDQLLGLLDGRTRDWRTLPEAGRSVPATFAVAGPERDRAAVARLIGVPAEAKRTFESYDALRAAMGEPGSGLVAFVPLEEVRLPMVALAVDGLDLVRGRGDTTAWPFAERFAARAQTGRGREALSSIAIALTAKPLAAPVLVVATGDVLQSRCSLARIQATGDPAAALRSPVGEYLAAAGLALTSLDASIQDVGAPFLCVETTNLTSPPSTLEALKLAGVDVATIATNHAFDCGQVSACGNRGFLRMMELLRAAGLRFAGGGLNLEEALAPVLIEAGGTRFGVLAFDDIAAGPPDELAATETKPGTAPLDDSYEEERRAVPPEAAFYRPAAELGVTRLQERVRRLKGQVDVVIVLVQSGTEDTHDASPRSIKALRAAADAGADLVVGNQAHWVQGVEVRGEAFIAYALGNFIFDQQRSVEHTQGYLLEAAFREKRLATVRLVPYQIVDQYRPTFVDGAVRQEILSDVLAASARLPK